MNRREMLRCGALVPALVPASLLVQAAAEGGTWQGQPIHELKWTTDMPTEPGQYLRRNPAVHSFTRCYIHNYMCQGQMNAFEPCDPPMQWFGPLPLPWEDEE